MKNNQISLEEVLKLSLPNLSIHDEIGSGANGTVFLTENTLSKKEYALKIWRDSSSHKDKVMKKFIEEIRKVKALPKHQLVNYIDHVDYIEYDGYIYCYYLMDPIDGITLDEYLKIGIVNEKERMKILTEFLESLSFIHKEGINISWRHSH